MNIDEVIKLFERIELFYPNKFDEERLPATISAWHSVLKDYTAEQVERNLQRHVKTSKFPPVVADLVVEQVKEGGPYIPNAQETREYLKQFNVELSPEEKAASKVAKAKLREWVESERAKR